MNESKITAAGQTTIPIEIRKFLGLSTGDKLRFLIDDKRVIITPVKGSIKDVKGILPKPSRIVSLEEMDEGIAAAANRFQE